MRKIQAQLLIICFLMALFCAHANAGMVIGSGCTLGSETVTNGSFDSDASGWTLGAPWQWGGGQYAAKVSDGTGTLSQTKTVAVDEVWRVTYSVVNWTQGAVTVAIGGTSGTSRVGNGTYTEDITAAGAGNLIFTPTDISRLGIDDVSVKLLTCE